MRKLERDIIPSKIANTEDKILNTPKNWPFDQIYYIGINSDAFTEDHGQGGEGEACTRAVKCWV